jgi:Zn-dependent protease
MLLGSPDSTPYDLRFRLLDIPVRVHPLFWLVMLIIGPHQDLLSSVVFISCAFVSILVHEFGHGLSSRALGREPMGVVLYAMGGFCMFDAEHTVPWKRLIVLACGPGAGFLLLAFVLAFANAQYGITPLDALALIGVGGGDPFNALMPLRSSRVLIDAFFALLYINFWWGVFNLFPIWPLDGGRMLQTVLGELNPRDGVRWSHVVSLLTAGGLAVYRASSGGPGAMFSALWIGSFAFLNYQILQSMHDAYRWGEDHRWRG